MLISCATAQVTITMQTTILDRFDGPSLLQRARQILDQIKRLLFRKLYGEIY